MHMYKLAYKQTFREGLQLMLQILMWYIMLPDSTSRKLVPLKCTACTLEILLSRPWLLPTIAWKQAGSSYLLQQSQPREGSATSSCDGCTWVIYCSRTAQDNEHLQLSDKQCTLSYNVQFLHLADTILQTEGGGRAVILTTISTRITSSITISTATMGLAAQILNCCRHHHI